VPLPYTLLCTLVGLVLGWFPWLVHGPIPEKFNLYYIRGAVAVWGWYNARMLIGFLVGITTWPPQWYVRGPLCGLLMLFPLGFVSLATPTCGPVCMFWNEVSASAVGFSVAAIAFFLTGKSHR